MPSHARTHSASPYDHKHRQIRAALIPKALGTACPARYSPNCTRIMRDPKMMHLDHTMPVALGGMRGDRIICAPCNLGMGAALGNRIRGTRTRTHVRKQRRALPTW